MIEIQRDESSSSNPYAGPAWNNYVEYPSVDSNEFKADIADAKLLIQRVQALTDEARPLMLKVQDPNFTLSERTVLVRSLQELSVVRERAFVLIENLSCYIHFELSTDASNQEVRRTQTQMADLKAELSAAARPYQLYIERTSDEVFEHFIDSDRVRHEEANYRRLRAQRDLLLDESEEVLLKRLFVHGPVAFGQLYSQISSSLVCRFQLNNQLNEMGLAEAAGLLRDSSDLVRRAAWIGIQEAWRTQSISCASVLNSLAGWRLEVVRLRSLKAARPGLRSKVDFLTAPLEANRLERASLDNLFKVLESARPLARRGAKLLARVLGKEQLDPWDLISSAPTGPVESRFVYKQALSMIRQAFSDVDPKLGEFVTMMEKNKWLEGRAGPNRVQGAYCWEFPKSRSPRVFQTYMGSVSDIRTLAHELGHAYHAWALRSKPYDPDLPMTLAETASLFAETLVSDQIEERGSDAERFAIGWQNVIGAVGMLMNIPARFAFEKSFYEKRANGFVSAEELSDLTEEAWDHWYGAVLSLPERQFWMSKLHFSIAELSFYNFPYTFGYLLALATYAKRSTLPRDQFLPFYDKLLNDTSSLSCEDLIQRHFRVDLTDPKSSSEFWGESLKAIEKQIDRFERLVESRKP